MAAPATIFAMDIPRNTSREINNTDIGDAGVNHQARARPKAGLIAASL
jgi:hypothetical protein